MDKLILPGVDDVDNHVNKSDKILASHKKKAMKD